MVVLFIELAGWIVRDIQQVSLRTDQTRRNTQENCDDYKNVDLKYRLLKLITP